jgi:tetratricopeptide (TPR) repeat protein
MLPDCDPSRQWELINAGGVSYASYRVASLMEELVRYTPDLLIIYTGHNEFLEDRTYGQIKQRSPILREVWVLLCRTRVFAALRRARANMGGAPAGGVAQGSDGGKDRSLLPAEVDTILEHSLGPEAYHRDDKLHRDIIAHFRFNLNRMIDIANSVDARVILVTPASQLRDCSPFKSEHRADLVEADWTRFQTLYENAEQAYQNGQWDAALAALDEASRLDDRYADLHYLRGRVLFALGRYDESKVAYTRARDEDVCPLRAVTALVRVVSDIAQTRSVPLVDADGILQSLSDRGIPGSDVFLDHVHPTIENNRQIALAILDSMKQQDVVHPSEAWNQEAIQAAKRRVEDGIDPEAHGVALRNLSMVLRWAGRSEEADRLAQRATDLAPDDAMAHAQRGATAEAAGRIEEAIREYKQAIELDPDSLEAHFGLADVLASQGKYEEAVREYHEALRVNSRQSAVLCNLGTALEALGRIDEAAAALRRAIEIKPGDGASHYNLGNLFRRVGRLQEAAEEYRQTLLIYPYSEDARVHFNLARVLVELDRYDAALDHFRQAVRFAPERPEVLQGLAWCLITYPDPNQRDATQAIELAKRANSLTGNQNPTLMDTLAAAYAEAGNFAEAVLVQRQALALAEHSDQNRIDLYRRHLARYEQLAGQATIP